MLLVTGVAGFFGRHCVGNRIAGGAFAVDFHRLMDAGNPAGTPPPGQRHSMGGVRIIREVVPRACIWRDRLRPRGGRPACALRAVPSVRT